MIENRKENKLLTRFQRILQPIAIVALLFVGVFLGIGLGNNYVSVRENLMDIESETLVADFLFNDVDIESIELFLIEEDK